MSKKNIALVLAYDKGYRISSCGNYLNTPFNIIKIKSLSSAGYPIFGIKIEGKKVTVTWHRLQAYQKYKNEIFKDGIVVRHKNSIKIDCSWDNILIGNQKENCLDNPETDRLKYAINATDNWRKYNATEIKFFYSFCKSYKKTMDKFNISSKGTLHFILNNAKYS